jgi:hypothetical protein
MELNPAIAARVAAYYTCWVDPDNFARSAGREEIYVQRHPEVPEKMFSFYVIGRQDQEVDSEKLREAGNLTLVLPSDIVSLETLSLLSSVEESISRNEIGGLFEIQLVSMVGPRGSQESKFACIAFSSADELAGRIIASGKGIIGGKGETVSNISELTSEQIRVALDEIFRPFEKSNSITLEEIDEYALKVKSMGRS